jgi:hypothetical protein
MAYMMDSRTRKKFLPLVSVLFPPEEQDRVRERLLAESPSRRARHATDSYKQYQREYYQRKKLLKQTGK